MSILMQQAKEQVLGKVQSRFLGDVKLPIQHIEWMWKRRSKLSKRAIAALWRAEVRKQISRQLGSFWAKTIAVRRPHRRRILQVNISHKRVMRPQFIAWIRRNLLSALQAAPREPGWFYARNKLSVRIHSERSELQSRVQIILRQKERGQ